MRGKLINIDSWFFIIFLSLSFYIVFALPNAEAITRDELDELKEKEKRLERDIELAEERLQDQREKINEKEFEFDNFKDQLRQINGTTWDVIKEKNRLEIEIGLAGRLLDEYREELGNIIREKSDWIKELRLLDVDNQKLDKLILPDLAPKIGIALSKNCITMLTNNFNSTCPNYKDFITLDNSNTDISGKFVTTDGFFHRDVAQVEKSWRVYGDENLMIFVDPPRGMAERIKMIYIENNFDDYFIPGDLVEHEQFEYVDYIVNKTYGDTTESKTIQVLEKTGDFGRIVYHDRYVDGRCKNATLNASNVTSMLADTIHFMRSECDESQTSFVTKEVIPIERSYQDYTTTQDYREKEFLKYVKEFCIFKFKAC